MEYTRKYFIDDLFIPIGLLNKFDFIEFENVNILLKCLESRFYIHEDNVKLLTVNVNSEEEFKTLSAFILSSNHYSNTFNIKINYQENNILNILSLLKEKPVTISYKYDEEGMAYFSEINKVSNNVILQTEINFENYYKILNNITKWKSLYNLYTYNFEVDYYSFEEAKLSDVHKIEFFLDNFMYIAQEFRFNYSDHIPYRAFISSDFKIYPGIRAFNDNYYIFDLKKYYDTRAEDIPSIDLNSLMAYTEFPDEQYFNIKARELNGSVLDLYQNFKVNENYSKLPLISEFFARSIV